MPAPQKNNRRDRNNNKPQHRINEQIRCREVRIVGDDVESEVMPTRQAIQLAQQKGVDLVEISPNAVPPVCRLINYSKFLYQQKKRQKELKAKGQPWELAKGFDGSAVLGEWVEKEKFLGPQRLHFHLDINGKTVQTGCTADMLYTIDELISYASRYFTLKTGDLFYTGCPTGCGPVAIDDHLEGWLEDRKVLDFQCK